MLCFSIRKPSPEASLISLYIDFDGLTSCIFSSKLYDFANNSFQIEENSVPDIELKRTATEKEKGGVLKAARSFVCVGLSSHLFYLHSVTSPSSVLEILFGTSYLYDVPIVAKLDSACEPGAEELQGARGGPVQGRRRGNKCPRC